MVGADGSSCRIHTVVVKIKYISAQNVVTCIHTENCKLELLLDCSVSQAEKNICRMCGIDESSRRRGFADFALEVFYIDFIGHFKKYHNTLCLSPQILYKYCLQFLLGLNNGP